MPEGEGTETSNQEGKETQPETPEAGTQESTTSLIDKAAEQADRLKEENTRREKLLEREEKLQARRELGGNSLAGQQQPKPKEETPQEYKDRVLRGDIDETG